LVSAIDWSMLTDAQADSVSTAAVTALMEVRRRSGFMDRAFMAWRDPRAGRAALSAL
jgi:hypothetical protein